MKRLLLIGISFVLIFSIALFAVNYLKPQNSPAVENQLTTIEESYKSEQALVTTETATSANQTTSLEQSAQLTDNETSQTSTEENSVTTIEATTVVETEKNIIATDLPETLIIDSEDNKFSMYRLFDKPTIINVWASWCPPCRKEMPYFQQYYEEHGEDIRFIMLNATQSRPTETIEVAKEYLSEFNYTFPVYFDIGFNNQVKLGTTILPYTIVIDKNGQVERYPGLMTEEQLAAIINSLLE